MAYRIPKIPGSEFDQSMTLYDTLEVEPYASQREIKRSYRRLARRYHPDYNPGDAESEERFKEIVSAYEVLSDREKRADYDARIREPRTTRSNESGGWKPPERTTQEWKDLERDLRRWHRRPPYDVRDAHVGALLAVSLTLASNASREVGPFMNVLVTAIVAGLITSVPLRIARVVGRLPVRIAATVLAPFAAAIGAIIGATLTTGGPPPSLWGGSGLPFAFVGGAGGALVGGMLGRSFRHVSEPVVGALVGGFSGAFLGAGLGGLFWYWSSILRWLEWPARDDLSELASAGVVGAFLGAALAAALGGTRDP